MLDNIDIEPNSEESKEVDKVYYEGDWRKKQKELHEERMKNVEEEETNYQIAKKQVRNILKTLKNQNEKDEDEENNNENLFGISTEGFTC